ncbi:hypothetical protein DF040_29545 [Burkholderia cenocepacia]|nr:hypothetical protein DF040_29545 [Burkholderia cenocepacia]
MRDSRYNGRGSKKLRKKCTRGAPACVAVRSGRRGTPAALRGRPGRGPRRVRVRPARASGASFRAG